MPLVYRVENDKGEGMYHSGSSRVGIEMCGDRSRHPHPRMDTKLMNHWKGIDSDSYMDCYSHFQNFYFGFANLDQLNFWIYNDEWKTMLKEDGFFIAVYEVETLFVGNTQAVFPIGCAKKLVDKIEF